jgi:hypothetical protein
VSISDSSMYSFLFTNLQIKTASGDADNPSLMLKSAYSLRVNAWSNLYKTMCTCISEETLVFIEIEEQLC